MNFRELRKRSGLKQKDLVRKLDVKKSAVSMWETGKSRPKIDMLPKLAEALNCSVEEIVNCFKEPQKNFSARM